MHRGPIESCSYSSPKSFLTQSLTDDIGRVCARAKVHQLPPLEEGAAYSESCYENRVQFGRLFLFLALGLGEKGQKLYISQEIYRTKTET